MEIYREMKAATPPSASGKTVSFGVSGEAPNSSSSTTTDIPLTRSGRKPLKATTDHNIRPRGTPHIKSKHSQSNVTPEVFKENKENNSQTRMEICPASATIATTTPTSAHSFRRTLRGTSPKQPPSRAPTIGEMAAVVSNHGMGFDQNDPVDKGNNEKSTVSNGRDVPSVNGLAAASDTTSLKPIHGTDAVTKGGGGGGGGGGGVRRFSKRMTNLGAASRVGGGGALGPPQRVAPKTPNSLLRTELNRDYDDDDDDDDYWNDQDESLLVSPPGALWNVLGATNNPSSASSTGVVLVPPRTAAAIHEITTSQKKQKHRQAPLPEWASPPLQPRSLLQTTPESVEEVPVVASRSTNDMGSINGESRKGVALDMSTTFLNEDYQQKDGASARTKPTPPPHLLERLQKPTARSKASATSSTTQKVDPPPKKTSLEKTKATLDVKAEPKGNGLSMDMSEVFSSQTSTVTQSAPPVHLLERLNKRTTVKDSKNDSHTKSAANSKVTSKLPRPVKKESADPKPPASTQLKSSGEDQNVDKSMLRKDINRSNVSSEPMSAPAPPLYVSKQLEQRTNQIKTSTSVTGKENKNSQTNRTILKDPTKKANDASNRAKSSKFKDGSSRVLPLALSSKTDPKPRARLQKNDKFFPSETATGKSNNDVPEPVAKKSSAVAFEISAPKESVTIQKSTPVRQQQIHKAESSIKIAREANDWAGKQCDTFVSWLNYTFHPDEDEDGDPGTGRSGLRALVIHRRLAQVRFRASELFHNDAMTKMRNTVQSEIARGRLAIRPDRDLYADLSLRKQATQLLLSYTTPWLRLGLEVMFGETIMPERYLQDQAGDGLSTPVARMRATLRAFVVDRFLSDSSVLMKYTKGKTKVPSGKFEKLFREEMRTLVLYRLMVLILFLDHAKTANIIDKVPRLFTKSSEVKSSKGVLLAVCRDFLSAEGDFIKHLSRIGLKVSYVQDPIDELEFNVTNLATDLRDGGRLTRMTEIVTDTPFKTMMMTLRLPAVSRLQKMHNVNVALSKLKESGVFVATDLNAHHIVDAHREMVLKLMWSVIAHACVTKLLEGNQVEGEIDNVLRSRQARRKLQGLKARSPRYSSPDRPTFDSNTCAEDILKSLLLRWCRAVCSNFCVDLKDFTDSFADGKALCYLVHYYHPGVLRLDEILPTSNDFETELSQDQALSNERSNSAMVAKRVTELGGIPKMLPVTDTTNPPDERSMLLCLTYLCSRLMESSEEIFATILIQACYRRYRDKVLHEKKQAAALVIFRIWSENRDNYYAAQERRYAVAVAVLENFVVCHRHGLSRMKRTRLERERRQIAAVEIQRCLRGILGRALFFTIWQSRHAAIIIQKYYRRYCAHLDLLERMLERDAASLVQSTWRSFKERCRWVKKINAVLTIQKSARGRLIRKKIQQEHLAAITLQKAWWRWVEYADSQVAAILIQSRWRGIMVRAVHHSIGEQRHAATVIQKVWRGYCKAIMFAIRREFAISIQKVTRGYLSRKILSLQRLSQAATLLQKAWRGFLAQVQFNIVMMDIVSIQNLARLQIARRTSRRRLSSVSCLQGAMRCALSRRALNGLRLKREHELRQEHAAIVCQCAVRAWRAKTECLFRWTKNMAARNIQRSWRTFVARQSFLQKNMAATLIQSRFRGVSERKYLHTILNATAKIQRQWRLYSCWKLRHDKAVLIQSRWRAEAEINRFQYVLACVVAIQGSWRRCHAQTVYERRRLAAIRVQASWRRHSAMYNYELDILEVVISQSMVRRMCARLEARRRRQSIQTIQYFVRRVQAVATLERLRRRHRLYVKQRDSAIFLQASVRALLARKNLRRSVSAATRIASHCRVLICRRHLRLALRGAVSMQALQRGRRVRISLHLQKNHAVEIQRIWRGFSQYVKYSVTLCDIVLAQSTIRRYLARAGAAERISATLRLQSFVRRKAASRHVKRLRKEFAELSRWNLAAQKIQAAYRGNMVLQELWWKHSQATLIQSMYKGRIARMIYELDRHDIIVTQSLVRSWLSKRICVKKLRAVQRIQMALRTWIARRTFFQLWSQKQRDILENSAAVSLQKTYRGYLVRRDIVFYHEKATRIQSAFRKHYWTVWYEMCVIDVIMAQSIVRRWIIQRTLQRAQGCAEIIQCFTRKFLAIHEVNSRRAKRDLWQSQNFASLTIQKLWRGHKSRTISIGHASARKIQKTWRCFAAHVDYLVKQISVIRLQAEVRRILTLKRFNSSRLSIIKAQAMIRGFLQRDYLRFVSLSATIIQSISRQHLIRQRFLRMRHSATTIQGAVRGFFTREDLELKHFAASEIQRAWRGFVQFCDYFVHLEAVVKLQSFLRMSNASARYKVLKLAAWIERRFYSNKAKSIQRQFRSYVHRKCLIRAATSIQATVRSFIRRTRTLKIGKGAKRLQAVFRARIIRRRRTKKVAALVNRLNIANRKAEKDPKLQIGYKTRHALKVLQSSKSLAEIMDAVKSLETSTRLSSLCCVLFVEADAARILLDLIRSCNRSVPHVELVQCILLTLDNVSRYRKLVPSFADCNSAEIFLDKMQMFRDKDGIFCLSISLLQSISDCNPLVEEFCAMHEYLKRLKALHQLSLRRSRPANSQTKQGPGRKANRMKKREDFDRPIAIRSLGMMAQKFESQSILSPKHAGERQHFKF